MEQNKKIIIGIVVGLFVLTIFCLCSSIIIFPMLLTQSTTNRESSITQSEENLNNDQDLIVEDECDMSNSEYFSFHGVEKVIVSENPCEVMWLLAKVEDSYQMKTKDGRILYITVWRDYEDNVTPGSTFTIRALDVTEDNRESASISITRWVSSESDLTQAKLEVQESISNL